MAKGLEPYVDVDFDGNFDKGDTQSRDTVRSGHGYIGIYKGCPISWKS